MPKTELNAVPMSQQKYIEQRAICCPACRSKNISTAGHSASALAAIADTDYAFQNVKCNDCKATWDIDFKLVGYSELEIPEVA